MFKSFTGGLWKTANCNILWQVYLAKISLWIMFLFYFSCLLCSVLGYNATMIRVLDAASNDGTCTNISNGRESPAFSSSRSPFMSFFFLVIGSLKGIMLGTKKKATYYQNFLPKLQAVLICSRKKRVLFTCVLLAYFPTLLLFCPFLF